MFDINPGVLTGIIATLVPVLLLAMILGLTQIYKAVRRGFASSKDTGERYMTKNQTEAMARGIASNLIDQKIKVQKQKVEVA